MILVVTIRKSVNASNSISVIINIGVNIRISVSITSGTSMNKRTLARESLHKSARQDKASTKNGPSKAKAR